MGKDDKLDWAPEPTPGETAEEAIKTVTTALAGPGAPLAVQLWEAVSPGYQARLHDWYDNLTEAINDLKKKYREFEPENLAKNEAFKSAMWKAAQAAIGTHQDQKLEYLRNAVLNTVLPGNVDEQQQLIFLQLVDRLAVLHVQILAHLNNPAPYVEGQEFVNKSPGWLVQHRFQNLRGSMLRYILAGLEREGLLSMPAESLLNNPVMPKEHSKRRTSDFGRDFIRFVTKPPSKS